MARSRVARIVLVAACLLLVAPIVSAAQTAAPGASPTAPGLTVVASGLTNPRGFTWGPDGTLYVGLAGTGGTDIAKVAGTPTGFVGGLTASVVAIRSGCPTPVTHGLPSSELKAFGWIWGAMDVAFLQGQLYVLIGGGGPIHGNPTTSNGIYRIATDGTVTLVADLGTWVNTHPVAKLPPEGFPNEGSWFAMVADGASFWVSDAVNGQILRVTPEGRISRVADLSAGHPVPDGLAPAPGGGVYVGYEGTQPFPDGKSKVSRVTANGQVSDVWTGLTMVTGVAAGPDGTLYAAEMATGNSTKAPFIHAGTGKVVRQTGPATAQPIATGLNFPVALHIGPDGAAYVSSPAIGASHGEGTILRIAMSAGTAVAMTGSPSARGSCAVATPIS